MKVVEYVIESYKIQIGKHKSEDTIFLPFRKMLVTSFYVNFWNLENLFISYQA